MIVSLRGTHGSGKSTVAQQFLRKFAPKPLGEGKRPEGYEVRVPSLRKELYIVGPYHTACGGCDSIQPYELIWPRVEQYARWGHVLFEGALVSSSVGEIGRAMARRKDCVVAFLDTPLSVCLERIVLRRKAKGDLRPLNPHNTTVKFEGILRSRSKFEALGLRCVDIPYRKAFAYVLALLEGK